MTVVEVVDTRMGRPTVITDEEVRKLEEAFKCDCTDEEACAYAKISETAYYTRKRTDPTFRTKMEQAKQYVFLIAKKSVVGSMTKGNGKLGLDFLKARQPSIYAERQQHSIYEGSFSVEELRAREAQLRTQIAALEGGTGQEPNVASTDAPREPGEANGGEPEAATVHSVETEDTGVDRREPNGEDGSGSA